MDFKLLHITGRDNDFKEAVMETARGKAKSILHSAEKKRAKALDEARSHCAEANHDLIAAKYIRRTEQNFSSVAQQKRRELLLYRNELVKDLFKEVSARLADLAAGKEYPAWLLARLEGHSLPTGKGVEIALRTADMPHAAALEKALPGCKATPDDSIKLGGFNLRLANIRYDDTLDAALEDGKRAFFARSRLSV